MKKIINNIKNWNWELIIGVSIIVILGILLIGCIVLCVLNGQTETSDYKPQSRVLLINGKPTVFFF